MEKAPIIEQVEFTEEDHARAKEIAFKLGYTETAYTSGSALWGLFCMARGHKRKGCIIKTKQFGMMFVQDMEDLGA